MRAIPFAVGTQEVLRDPSLMWACWLLEYLLADVSDLVPAEDVHDRAVFAALLRYGHLPVPHRPAGVRIDAHDGRHPVCVPCHLLARYLRTPGAPFKARIVCLMTRLLKRPHAFVRGPPDFRSVDRVEEVVMGHCVRERASGNVFLPSALQQLVRRWSRPSLLFLLQSTALCCCAVLVHSPHAAAWLPVVVHYCLLNSSAVESTVSSRATR